MAEEQDGGMSREDAVAMLQAGKIKEWNEYRLAHEDWRPDLPEANLGGADLRCAYLKHAALFSANLVSANLGKANLENAILVGAQLRSADLIGANLIGAHLRDADLSRARLTGANLTGARLRGADLSRAKLRNVNLSLAHLRDADLTRAMMGFTLLSSNDLSEVKGLDTVRHAAPSYVDIHTLLKSEGEISRRFLRRCGMPEGWIDYLPALIGMLGPIQFHSCFISHSTDDKILCEKLYHELQEKDVSVFYAPEDLKGGDWFDTQLEQAIEVNDKLLLVLSESSMASPWVENEIRWAFAKEERTNARVLFPIRICDWKAVREWKCPDTDKGVDLARRVRRYNILDFTENELTFEEALTRLIKDLQTDEKPDNHD